MLFTFPAPLNKVVNVVEGEKWKRIRSILTPNFSAYKMKQMLPLINSACDMLREKLEEMSQFGESFNNSNRYLICLIKLNISENVTGIMFWKVHLYFIHSLQYRTVHEQLSVESAFIDCFVCAFPRTVIGIKFSSQILSQSGVVNTAAMRYDWPI